MQNKVKFGSIECTGTTGILSFGLVFSAWLDLMPITISIFAICLLISVATSASLDSV
jgi:hypothetical protein